MTAWTRTARTGIGHRPHSTVATPNVPSLPSVLQQSYYTKEEEVLRRHDPAPHRFQYPVYVCHGKWKVTFWLVYWPDLEQIMIEVMDFQELIHKQQRLEREQRGIYSNKPSPTPNIQESHTANCTLNGDSSKFSDTYL